MNTIAPQIYGTNYQVPSPCEGLKLLAQELCLSIYQFVLEIFVNALNSLNYLSCKLNDHLFEVKSWSDYLKIKGSSILLQGDLAPFIKAPMLNILKMQDIEQVDNPLTDYLERFENECNENIQEWMETYLRSFAGDDQNFINEYLQDLEKLQAEIMQILPSVEELKVPSKGICKAAVATIFSSLKENPQATLMQIIAEFEEGVGIEIAGLHALYCALFDKFKQHPNNAVFFGGKDPEFHLYNLLGIKSSQKKQISIGDFHSLESIDDSITEILNLEDGCYCLSISALHNDMNYFRSIGKQSINITSTLVSHCIFLRKQDELLEIIDPNFGLLEAVNENESITILRKLLPIYLKSNKAFSFDVRRFEE